MPASRLKIPIIAAACLSAGYFLRLLQESPTESPGAASPPHTAPSGRPRAIVVRGTEKEDQKTTSGHEANGKATKISPDELGVILGVARAEPEGLPRLWRLEPLLRDLLRQHPDALINWCRQSQYADAMIEDLIGRWGSEDPQGCAKWLSKKEKSPERDGLISRFLNGALSTGRPLDGAWAWVRAISDPAKQADAALLLGGVELWEDRAAAEQELAGLDLPDEVAATIRQGWEKQAKERVQRDAMNLVSIYQSARSSGAIIKAGSAEEIVQSLTAGVSVDDVSSPFHGKRFSLPPISEARLPHSLRHVKFERGELDYVQEPEE